MKKIIPRLEFPRIQYSTSLNEFIVVFQATSLINNITTVAVTKLNATAYPSDQYLVFNQTYANYSKPVLTLNHTASQGMILFHSQQNYKYSIQGSLVNLINWNLGPISFLSQSSERLDTLTVSKRSL